MNDYFKYKYSKKIEKVSFSKLNDEEVSQLLHYIWIYKHNQFQEHWEVNKYISEHDIWDDFSLIRSLNDHGHEFKVKGITPKYFAIVCRVLEVDADDGSPLIDFEKY